MKKQKWQRVLGYPNYYISRKGEVSRQMSDGTFKMLKASNNGNGYLRVNLYKNGLAKKHYIHRLVAKAFLSNPNKHPEVHHKDHDKSNNTLENLKWVSSVENNTHKVVFYRKHLKG